MRYFDRIISLKAENVYDLNLFNVINMLLRDMW